MAKPLRIGTMLNVDKSLPDTVAELRRFAEALGMPVATTLYGSKMKLSASTDSVPV